MKRERMISQQICTIISVIIIIQFLTICSIAYEMQQQVDNQGGINFIGGRDYFCTQSDVIIMIWCFHKAKHYFLKTGTII